VVAIFPGHVKVHFENESQAMDEDIPRSDVHTRIRMPRGPFADPPGWVNWTIVRCDYQEIWQQGEQARSARS
jgi:hypothetical protein